MVPTRQWNSLNQLWRRLDMSSFRKRFGGLTVAQAKELNEAAKWYCGHEITSEAGDGN